jgi:hypothetical protein
MCNIGIGHVIGAVARNPVARPMQGTTGGVNGASPAFAFGGASALRWVRELQDLGRRAFMYDSTRWRHCENM